MKGNRIPVRLLMMESSPYYHRRYMLVKYLGRETYAMRPMIPVVQRDGKDIPLQQVLDKDKSLDEELEN